MSKLMGSIGKTIIDQIVGQMFQSNNTGLIRLFETEYQKDYRHAIKSGAVITDDFVRSFLESNKQFH